jgi:hypothetical protein
VGADPLSWVLGAKLENGKGTSWKGIHGHVICSSLVRPILRRYTGVLSLVNRSATNSANLEGMRFVLTGHVRTTILVILSVIGLHVSAILTEASAQYATFDKRERCAAIARRRLDDYKKEFEATKSTILDETDDVGPYESHFDNKDDKCFLYFARAETFNATGTIVTEWYLVDAIERRFIATFSEVKAFDIQLAQATGQHVPRSDCELTPSWREKIVCRDRKEFDAFVAKYMSD